MMFAGIYYSTQRLLKARLASRPALAASTSGAGRRSSSPPRSRCRSASRRARSTPSSIGRSTSPIAVVWVVFARQLLLDARAAPREAASTSRSGSTSRRSSPSAMLHIVNNLVDPDRAALKSYPIFGGVQDALVQWWYGHNAVAFFLTTPFLGIMYYFLPKAAERPVYSYRLSIIHFWSLVFIYIWAGPHHLLYTALPDWAADARHAVLADAVGAVSWGGMLNGLLTLRGAWDKLRTDPVLKFFAAGVTFYGMATFEGPLLSHQVGQRARALHRLDRRPRARRRARLERLHGRRHVLLAAAAALGPSCYSTRARRTCTSGIGTVGILLYVAAMWIARHHAGPDVARARTKAARSAVSELRRDAARHHADVLDAPGRRRCCTSPASSLMAWNLLDDGARAAARRRRGRRVTERCAEREPEAPWQELAFGKPVCSRCSSCRAARAGSAAPSRSPTCC